MNDDQPDTQKRQEAVGCACSSDEIAYSIFGRCRRILSRTSESFWAATMMVSNSSTESDQSPPSRLPCWCPRQCVSVLILLLESAYDHQGCRCRSELMIWIRHSCSLSSLRDNVIPELLFQFAARFHHAQPSKGDLSAEICGSWPTRTPTVSTHSGGKYLFGGRHGVFAFASSVISAMADADSTRRGCRHVPCVDSSEFFTSQTGAMRGAVDAATRCSIR